MRREHSTIVVDVLDALARYGDENRGVFHVTALASRANLPHDRLRTCLDELATMGLVTADPVPAPTVKGRQFLECYHAWVRVQQLYGLQPASMGRRPLRTVPALPTAPAAPVPAPVPGAA